MRIFIVLTSLLAVCLSSFAQTCSISYKNYSNGQYLENEDYTMFINNGVAFLSGNENKIKQFTDFNKSENVNIISYEGKLYKTLNPFSEMDVPASAPDTTIKILGYNCRLAVYNSFSNRIEVWYTTDAKAFGSPYKSFIPAQKSLVLKIIINGNREIVASDVKKDKNAEIPDYPYDEAIEISEPEFEELKIMSRYSIVKIFENERINFDPEIAKNIYEDVVADQVYNLSNGGIILKKIKLPIQALEGSYCFAKLTLSSAGDAYDRTGTVFILPDTKNSKIMLKSLFEGKETLPIFTSNINKEYQGMIRKDDFVPQTEVMRFFTSFGVGHFNNYRPINNYLWADKASYKQEITELIPDTGEYIWVGVFIGNYDKGGHIVSLEFNFYPGFDENPSKSEKFVLPLFNTVNILEMSGQNYGSFFRTDTLEASFEIPENLSNPNLIYTSTGHGGWENGDEFVPKQNKILIDDKEIYSFVPWRTDCATYRLSNPASGNFGNGLSSSDLSRSNWCPGTLTNPEYIPLHGLNPGKHNIKIVIDQGQDEGSSFSFWSVSGTITGKIYYQK